jgi:hypothetical protein
MNALPRGLNITSRFPPRPRRLRNRSAARDRLNSRSLRRSTLQRRKNRTLEPQEHSPVPPTTPGYVR